MNFIKNLFVKRTNYPRQQLSQKQKDILNYMDNYLVELHSKKVVQGENMRIESIIFPLQLQYLPTSSLNQMIRNSLLTDEYYIPRSIALVCDYEGTWHLYYALRTSKQLVNDNTLFIDAMGRTNDARSKV